MIATFNQVHWACVSQFIISNYKTVNFSTHIRQHHFKKQNSRESVFSCCFVGAKVNADIDHVPMISFDDVIIETTKKHVPA